MARRGDLLSLAYASAVLGMALAMTSLQTTSTLEAAMSFVISFVLGTLFFAIGLKVSLMLLDNGNFRNTWGAAGLYGAIFALPAALGTGIFFGLLPLIALLFLLIRYYEVGLLRSFLVVILMGLINTGLAMIVAPLLAGLL